MTSDLRINSKLEVELTAKGLWIVLDDWSRNSEGKEELPPGLDSDRYIYQNTIEEFMRIFGPYVYTNRKPFFVDDEIKIVKERVFGNELGNEYEE